MNTSSAEEQVWELELASWNHLRSGAIESYMLLFDRRLSVHQVDDVIIAHFEVQGHAVTKVGQEFPVHDRFTHAWKRTAAGWKILGGMSASVKMAPTR